MQRPLGEGSNGKTRLTAARMACVTVALAWACSVSSEEPNDSPNIVDVGAGGSGASGTGGSPTAAGGVVATGGVMMPPMPPTGAGGGTGGSEFQGTGIRYTDFVDPFIGTGGPGNLNCFPGAILPWGMVAVSPETRPGSGDFHGHDHAAGYLAEDEIIRGFTHTRLQGTSTPDMGSVLLMPAEGEAASLITEETYRSTYDKQSEVAEAGYYAVTLTEPQVRVELTATRRGAHHRYTFMNGSQLGEGHVVLDLGHAMHHVSVVDANLAADGAVFEGMTVPSGRFSGPSKGGLKTFFSLKFDPSPTSFVTFQDGSIGSDANRSGSNIGAIATFDVSSNAVVEARVGISYVDVSGARGNREVELGTLDFEGTRKAASDAWQEQFESVSFVGGSDDQRTIMATALYHSFVVPSLVTDVDGRYRGYDDAIHTADFEYHTNFSMWDSYRTVHPLLSLVRSSRQNDLTRSLIQMAREGGYYPRWSMGHGYPNITAGSPGAIVVAESYLRGATGFDAHEALDLALKEIDDPPPPGHPHSGREGLADYLEKGYVPIGLNVPGVGSRVVVRTLEYAIADAAIANMAAALGRTVDHTRASAWAKNYQTLWNAENMVFCGRHPDGGWNSDCSPDNGDEHLYYGANARQYSWLAPHDMEGMVALHGTNEAFVARLSEFFEKAKEALDAGQGSTYYTHHNEPDIHAMYLFLAANRPDLTQRWVEWASSQFYSTARSGLAGNEDAGTLSAWYVLSQIGLYPVTSTDRWLIGRPAFPRIFLSVEGGTLTIEAEGAGPENPYVHGVSLNGTPLVQPWLDHDQIARGGVLSFEMSDVPGTWGAL